MAGKIFLNYRRGDDPGTTGRLYDRLEAEFPRGDLFMDVEGIQGGDDFVEVLKAQVAKCDVLLAVIGPRWLNIADDQGRRRLDNPDDWVRVEIVSALADGKRVIPVLVGGADIPRAEDLSDDLKPLARRQAIRITLERFKADAQGLVSQIKSSLADVEARRHAETEAERQALAEAERLRQAAEDARVAERVRQEAERIRAAQLAGMDPTQVRKAEELANWEFIKAKTDAAEFRDHIARFASGPTERFAEERLAGLTWTGLDKSDKVALRAFIDEFPKAPDIAAARDALARIEAREQAAREVAERAQLEASNWEWALKEDTVEAYERFLVVWPRGGNATAARLRIQRIKDLAAEVAAQTKAEHLRDDLNKAQNDLFRAVRRRDISYDLNFVLVNAAIWGGAWWLPRLLTDMPPYIKSVCVVVSHVYYAFCLGGIAVLVFSTGQAIAAVAFGIPLVAFSLGYGPEVLSFTSRSGASFRFRWLPLGGYIRFIDDENDIRSYSRQPIWKRFLVVLMGPIALLSIGLLLTGGNSASHVTSTIVALLRIAASPGDGAVALWFPIAAFLREASYLTALGGTFVTMSVLNMLPIPSIAGGNLVLLLWEGARRAPISERSLEALLKIGMLFTIIFGAILLVGLVRFVLIQGV